VKSAIAACGATAITVGLVAACARNPPATSILTPPAVVQARLDEADALAARGCYLCLEDAAEAYSKIVRISNHPVVLKKTLENDLMLAIREVELRLPDSGARQNAFMLRQHVPKSYETYFAVLDFMDAPLGARTTTVAELEKERAARGALLTRLEGEWPATPVAAYFYLAFGIRSAYFRDYKTDVARVVEVHPEALSLKYEMLVYPTLFDPRVAAELLAVEPRFAEVRLVLGQRALFGGGLVTARRELVAAHETLPESLAVKSLFGTVEFAYARYQQALALFDEILAAGPDANVQLARAEALSYLKRHREAIAVLDELLKDVQRNPGEKYYWRAWNRLQLTELQPAYDDAVAALRFMSGVSAFRLAGIATFNLERLPEARGYFDSAVKISSVDCDSIQYLGQIDSAERNWASAFSRFSEAAGCFQQSTARLTAELATKESQNLDGLLAGQIAGLKSDIEAQSLMQAQSTFNAGVVARNAGNREAALEWASRVVYDPKQGAAARQLIQQLQTPSR
jgi:tetratricopeptide (TPR) repeat protein